MRGIHTLVALSAMAAAVGVSGIPGRLHQTPRSAATKHDPERVAKAQAKRERRAAKRLKGLA